MNIHENTCPAYRSPSVNRFKPAHMYRIHVLVVSSSLFTRTYWYAIPVWHICMRYRYCVPVRTCKHRLTISGSCYMKTDCDLWIYRHFAYSSKASWRRNRHTNLCMWCILLDVQLCYLCWKKHQHLVLLPGDNHWKALMQDISAAKLLQLQDCQFLELTAWICCFCTFSELLQKMIRQTRPYPPCPRGLARYAAGLASCLCMALDPNSRAGQVIWVKMASAYALRLISRRGKRVWRCPL